MTNEFWFKPKRLGYGATPVTWEGWAVTLVSACVVAACVLALSLRDVTFLEWLSLIAIMVATMIALVVLSLKKTDGAWGWNAGADKISGKSE